MSSGQQEPRAVPPTTRISRLTGSPGLGWANVISAAVPLIERLGVATRVEVDPPTLADRLLAETLAHDGCVIGPPMTGAWSGCQAPAEQRRCRERRSAYLPAQAERPRGSKAVVRGRGGWVWRRWWSVQAVRQATDAVG
jgi:hypothetical protein